MRGITALVVLLMLTACAGAPPAEPDRVATRVAEDLAVAATLTAVARQSPQADTPQPPTDTPQPPAPAATDTPLPPTDTPAPPAATPTPDDPTVPGFGSTNGLAGEIILPGYTGPLDQIVFTDRIVFRLAVHDPDVGTEDGANIARVDISIDAPNGSTVNVQNEQTSWYCSFGGGAPACNVWFFSQHNKQWPSGEPVCAGQGYQANMIVTTQNGDKTDASWRFNFAVTGDYPPCF